MSRVLRERPDLRYLHLRALHAHSGSGIHDLRAFQKTAERVLDVYAEALRAGFQLDRLNLGGGLGTRLSREFTTWEMLFYLSTGRLPRPPKPAPADLFARYGSMLTETLVDGCRRPRIPIPQLVLEPGRALVSDAQVLLFTVGTVRHRSGAGRFVLTDGGAMTVSMMFLSEYHAIFLANREGPCWITRGP